MVYHGVKFSCHFTLKQIEQRWQALMYDELISKIAKRAINKLQLETIAGIESKILFSLNEEALLGTVHSVCSLFIYLCRLTKYYLFIYCYRIQNLL